MRGIPTCRSALESGNTVSTHNERNTNTDVQLRLEERDAEVQHTDTGNKNTLVIVVVVVVTRIMRLEEQHAELHQRRK